MSGTDLAHGLYLIREYCDAITNPQLHGNVAQFMSDIRTIATRLVEHNPGNAAIAALKNDVDGAYELFDRATLTVAPGLISRLHNIAMAVYLEAIYLRAA